jgi:hypothetical protein
VVRAARALACAAARVSRAAVVRARRAVEPLGPCVAVLREVERLGAFVAVLREVERVREPARPVDLRAVDLRAPPRWLEVRPLVEAALVEAPPRVVVAPPLGVAPPVVVARPVVVGPPVVVVLPLVVLVLVVSAMWV